MLAKIDSAFTCAFRQAQGERQLKFHKAGSIVSKALVSGIGGIICFVRCTGQHKHNCVKSHNRAGDIPQSLAYTTGNSFQSGNG